MDTTSIGAMHRMGVVVHELTSYGIYAYASRIFPRDSIELVCVLTISV